MRTIPVFLLAGFAALAVPARAEQFHYRFKAGQAIEFRASVRAASLRGAGAGSEMMKARMEMVVRQVQRVRSVRGGVATVEITDTPVSGKVMALGRSEAYRERPSRSILRITLRGRVLGIQAEGGAGPGGGLDGTDMLYGLNFPERDLKPGDTWEETRDLSEGKGGPAVRMSTRYIGRETVRGRSCAKFVTTFSVPYAPGAAAEAEEGLRTTEKMSGTVTTYFDPAAGVEVHSSGSVVTITRTDLSSLSPEAGEIASATRINFVQTLVSSRSKEK